MNPLFTVMPRKMALRAATPLLSALFLPLVACSGSGGSGAPSTGGGADAGMLDDGGTSPEGDAGSDAVVRLVLSPLNPTHTVGADGLPTLTFDASLTPEVDGAPAPQWSSDHPELGSIHPRTGVFTPSGAAGVATISVSIGARTASTRLTLRVEATEEGDPDAGNAVGGAGGIGGVGGEGGGTAITDKSLRDALDQTPTTDATLSWLYPYDETVWPRGLPAPLLQWRHGDHAPKAVKIRIEVDSSFVYEGFFGPPQALPANSPITRLPIPSAVWRNALFSGSEMRVSLTIAADDGAGGYTAYKPASDLTWRIAPGSLKGTVYYNSYGSKLAQQMQGIGGRFGGATLAIRGNSYEPVLVAGRTSGSDDPDSAEDLSGCRVCHSISGDGSLMIVQQEHNPISSRYSLTGNDPEFVYPSPADDGKLGWAALSPDGSIALGNSGPPGNTWANTASLEESKLYRVSDASLLTANGLNEFVTRAATPIFSVDGSRVAFNFFAGPGASGIVGDGRSLVMMNIARESSDAYTFSEPVELYRTAEAEHRPGWPFFLPDGSGVIFQVETAPGQDELGNREIFTTRGGAKGQLWWSDLQGNVQPLRRLNGQGYLPTGPNGHADDTELQFEPTVAPIVAGGYAWVVFTSRRMYGNVATRDPYHSDPRFVDISEGNPDGPTTKKLWVAAIDMPPKPGTDPSHPAFYLPAQELFAGNSRGFWVPDACRENGSSCESGDECCGGYCRADSDGKFVCTDELPPAACAEEYEACQVDSDCCAVDGKELYCIAGRCAQLLLY